MSTTEDQRTAYTTGLRKLADILDAHPEIPLPFQGSSTDHSRLLIGFHGDDGGERLAAAARAFPCQWDKRPHENWFNLDGRLAGLHIQIYAARDQVCRKVVTGTEEREVEEVVTPAVTRKVTKPVEVVEWQCQPLLAEKPAPDVAQLIEESSLGTPGARKLRDRTAPETVAAVKARDAKPAPVCINCGASADKVPLRLAGWSGTAYVCNESACCAERQRARDAEATQVTTP